MGLGVLDLAYRHVDVFSRRALQGNGLVVVLDAENLSPAMMQQLTREVRQFETAFLAAVDLPARSARLRIFTAAATGSAAGPAAGYLLHHGVRPGGEPLLVHQGRFTGRPSTIEVRPDPDGRLWVGGPVAPVAAGRFHAHLS